MGDAELWADYVRLGNVGSFTTVFRRHSPALGAFLRAMLGPGDCEDALQETWLRVVRHARDFRGGSFRAYLFTAARNVAIDRLRRRRDCVSLDAPCGDDGGETLSQTVPDSAPAPDAVCLNRMSIEEVRSAVSSLPLDQRQVLLMRINGEMTFEEIARELGVPLGTALTWMRRATIGLKKILVRGDRR